MSDIDTKAAALSTVASVCCSLTDHWDWGAAARVRTSDSSTRLLLVSLWCRLQPHTGWKAGNPICSGAFCTFQHHWALVPLRNGCKRDAYLAGLVQYATGDHDRREG